MVQKNINELPEVEPTPKAEVAVQTPEYGNRPDTTDMQASIAVEQGLSSMPMPDPASLTMPQVAGNPSQQPSVQAQNPVIADDNDLIEKAWVEKAKQIISQTKEDPYLQNKEVERMKADYMKKRYDKDIKLTED
jgi:hypothetical protein